MTDTCIERTHLYGHMHPDTTEQAGSIEWLFLLQLCSTRSDELS